MSDKGVSFVQPRNSGGFPPLAQTAEGPRSVEIVRTGEKDSDVDLCVYVGIAQRDGETGDLTVCHIPFDRAHDLAQRQTEEVLEVRPG